MPRDNIDPAVVEGFGQEWKRFDQRALSAEELQEIFAEYFRVFPWERIGPDAVGFDLGCGSGRWARLVSPRVGTLHCIDPSDAIEVARTNLAGFGNCVFHRTGVDDFDVPEASCDFGYSLGVLHHVPDTQAGIANCARRLKPGAPLLLYLYYAFDNRPWWFRALWQMTDLLRWVVARLPRRLKHAIADVIAVTFYWPLARMARRRARRGRNVASFPLSYYRDRSFYVMRNDALDRFGTRLERRFTRPQIETMMRAAGLDDIHFSEQPPYWCAVGFRAREEGQ